MYKFSALLLAFAVTSSSLAAAQKDKPTIPWPGDWVPCLEKPISSKCNGGLRWCTNGCLHWICGLCFHVNIPDLPAPHEFPWPPLGPLNPGGSVVINYDKISEKDLIQWLQSRDVKFDPEVSVGKDEIFKVAAAEVARVSGVVGVQGGILEV